MFVPKYYLNVERLNDENELLIECIDYPNLATFIEMQKNTMSYQTKIYFCSMIAQALRYLQEYQITHLDLKPSNIMLSSKMIVKIIDFGESHHPDFTSTA